MIHFRFSATTLSVWMVACASHVVAQTSDESSARSEQLQAVFRKAAAAYQITIGTGNDLQRLSLRDEPIMHWSSGDGTSGTYVGSMFVWTRHHRPEVVGTIFTPDGSRDPLAAAEELYSYSAEQLSVHSGEGKLWRPAPTEGMQFIPDAMVPAQTAQGRRLQLRQLARQFSGRMNRRGVHHPLRLLPRPVYEYEGEHSGVLGGALFVLVAYVTDPDILLLVEARQTDEGPRWFFQPARFSDKSLWLAFQEKDIWTSMRAGHGTDQPQAPDLQYHVEHVMLEAPLSGEVSESSEGTR